MEEILIRLTKQLRSNDTNSVKLAKDIIQNQPDIGLYFNKLAVNRLLNLVLPVKSKYVIIKPTKSKPQNTGFPTFFMTKNGTAIEYPQAYKGAGGSNCVQVTGNLKTEVGILWLYKHKPILEIYASGLYRKKYDEKRIENLYRKINRRKLKQIIRPDKFDSVIGLALSSKSPTDRKV